MHASQLTAATVLYLASPPNVAFGRKTVSLVIDRGGVGLSPGADCTALLQQAIDKLPPSGGEIVVLAGDYLVDPDKSVNLRSHVSLRLLPGAVLRAKETSSSSHAILRIQNARDVRISGGQLIGERDRHLGSGGEWGMGVDIRASQGVLLEDMHIASCWGDGVYIGSTNGSDTGGCSDITLRRVVAAGNRRQGLSIVSCNGALIEQCDFIDTHGTAPAAGIDLEPNAGETVEGVRIVNCTAHANQGDGFQFVGGAPGAKIRNCSIDGGVSTANRRYGVSLASASGCEVRGVEISDNANFGVYVQKTTHDCLIASNNIARNLAGASMRSVLTKAIAGDAGNGVMVESGARSIRVESSALITR